MPGSMWSRHLPQVAHSHVASHHSASSREMTARPLSIAAAISGSREWNTTHGSASVHLRRRRTTLGPVKVLSLPRSATEP